MIDVATPASAQEGRCFLGVEKYVRKGLVLWKLDETLKTADGREIRIRERAIPTREQALARAAQVRIEAYEGHFQRRREPEATIEAIWALYQPVGQRNDAWETDRGRAQHLLRHLGGERAVRLTRKHVEAYRTARLAERTRRGTPPSPATLDRELELLKRAMNYAIECGEIPVNPIAGVPLLKAVNVRKVVVTEDGFDTLVAAAGDLLRPILVVAYDCGMRKSEILELRWPQVDVRAGRIVLAPQDTKTDQPRIVLMTTRVVDALRSLPRNVRTDHVFVNPDTSEAWKDVRKMFRRACRDAALDGIWFHDLRRSFVTNARRRGVPESVVMRMSGHRTRAVFDRYNIINEDDLREAVRKIEAGAVAESRRSNYGKISSK